MDQRQAAGGAEVHVGLVDDDDVVRGAPHDALQVRDGHRQAGGVVGVRDEEGAAQGHVLLRADGEVLLQRNLLEGDAVQLGQHPVEPAGDLREGGGVVAVAEGHEGEVQDRAGAARHQHLLRCHVAQLRDAGRQPRTLRVRVEVQHIRGLGGVLHGPGGRGERRLVRIELKVFSIPRLFARNVGHEALILRAEKTAHGTGPFPGIEQSRRTAPPAAP